MLNSWRGRSFGAAAFAFLLLPGVGGNDARVPVDARSAPFTALARLNVPGVSRCTAVLLSPNFAATAAHCLTRPGLGHFVGAGSVHLLLGYRGGDWTRHIVPDLVILPPEARADGAGPRTADFALLHFAPPATDWLPPAHATPSSGTPLVLAGFNQDRVEQLEADRSCQVLSAGPLLRHDCNGTRGTSGGPLLASDGAGGFTVVGIQVAGGEGAGGVAVPMAAVARFLPAPAPR